MRLIIIILLNVLLSGLEVHKYKNPDYSFNCILNSITIEGSSNINHFYFTFINQGNTRLYFQNEKLQTDSDRDLVLFNIPVVAFNGNPMYMEHDFRSLLKASEFPVVSVSFEKNLLWKIISKRTLDQPKLNVTLTGITRTIKIENMVFNQSNNDLFLDGITRFRLSDFSIRPPEKMFGLVKVEDSVAIKFKIELKESKSVAN